MYQRLAGHTPGVQAVSAQLRIFFHQGHAQAQLRSHAGDHETTRTAPDHDKIIVFLHVALPDRMAV
jgi:hypothetical protein